MSNEITLTPAEVVKLVGNRDGLRNFLKNRNMNAPEQIVPFIRACDTPDTLLGIADHIGEIFGFKIDGEYWKYKDKSVVKATSTFNDALGKPELQLQFKLIFENDSPEATICQLFKLLAQIDPPSVPSQPQPASVRLPAAAVPVSIMNIVREGIPARRLEIDGERIRKALASESGTAKATRRFFIIPVKNFTNGFGMQIIQKSLLGQSWGFDDRTAKRLDFKPGDRVCFYLTKDGIVAQGELGEKLDRPYKSIPFTKDDLYPNRYRLVNGALLAKVVKIQTVLGELDYFRHHRVKNYGLIAQEVKIITEHDFNILTGTENMAASQSSVAADAVIH